MYEFSVITVVLLVIILYLIIDIRSRLSAEHQMPGHGSAGQHGLVENFYTSGALLRSKSEPTGFLQTIDQKDFAHRLKNYYEHKPLNSP